MQTGPQPVVYPGECIGAFLPSIVDPYRLEGAQDFLPIRLDDLPGMSVTIIEWVTVTDKIEDATEEADHRMQG